MRPDSPLPVHDTDTLNTEDHMYLEDAYCRSIIKCGHTNALLREVVQLGGLEMCCSEGS